MARKKYYIIFMTKRFVFVKKLNIFLIHTFSAIYVQRLIEARFIGYTFES